MKFRVRDLKFVHNNQLNSSVSKQQYSVPKAERFRNPKSLLPYKYYDIPSTNTRKAPTFGISPRRPPFQINTEIPAPTQYHIINLSKFKLQITFPKGRQQCKTLSFLKINQNPGPGTYNPNPQAIESNQNRKYSIRSKTQQSTKQCDQNPGPGRYTIKQTWIQKNKILSKDRKYGTPIYYKPVKQSHQSNRSKQNFVPYYNPKTTVTGQETFHAAGGFSIGKSKRFSNKNSIKAPGPGYYQRFSQFI